MGAAHGCFIYLTKLHLKVSQSLLTQEIWADAWDSFAFFYWKNGPGNGCFMVENGSIGTFYVFFPLRQEWKLERYALKL